jgi:hypothetical protein
MSTLRILTHSGEHAEMQLTAHANGATAGTSLAASAGVA